MKPEELDFLRRMIERANSNPYKNIIGFWETEPLPTRKWMYYLTKWTRKNWYEFGVSLRTGWFTPEGIEEINKILSGGK